MTVIRAKRPQVSDGSGVNLRTTITFMRQAANTLRQEGEDETAHYFEMVVDHLVQDVTNGKPFVFSNRVLGL